MKLFNLVCLTSLFAAASASAANFSPADDSVATKVCMSVVKDNKLHLHNTLKSSRLDKRIIEDKLHCNDLPVGEFAATYGFNTVAKYLGADENVKTSIKDIAKISDKTIHVSGSR
ncbi:MULTISPECIES: DUF3718 domain-containing protein [Pseudoalteromonas]|nr:MULTISPECIES: DUF3718 domain-containing protein [Pseudoalteromonas]NLR14156.1 DUF3718 domain-containing protein [Pseudoalteromonas peptidolytica]RXF02295.1 DUF3718 domain-containing protein [Pseudoalteromonas sp. PS5]GEK09434.1 hypothetical protein PPE03_16830 [Pseudoalteromonas peptidolytica]